MKLKIASLLIPLLAAVSCGTPGQVQTTQRFADGIYYRPSSELKSVQKDNDSRFSSLAERTRGNKIYIRGGKIDTLIIPERLNPRVSVQDSLTVIELTAPAYTWNDWRYDFYGWNWDYSWSWRPYGWYRPYHYGYHGWYRPYSWYSWDPWYYDS